MGSSLTTPVSVTSKGNMVVSPTSVCANLGSKNPTKKNILTETLALVSGAINEHLAANDVPKREEHLHQFGVPKLLRQVVDEEVAALGA